MMISKMPMEEIRKLIRAIPDFPKEGILFQDIFPLFRQPSALYSVIEWMTETIQAMPSKPTVLVGLDARGFLFGPAVALALNLPFVPVRKQGKLPGEVLTVGYAKEYGVDYFEMQKDAITCSDTAVVIDDLLATGGSAYAATQLIQQTGAQVVGFLFIIELQGLGGRQKLEQGAGGVHSLFECSAE